MKTVYSILAFLFATSLSFAQNGIAINYDGAAPAASAMLEVKATNRGVLIPRMTQAQRNAITSPATSLLIYQTDNTPGFYYYSGSAWTAIGGDNDWAINGNDVSHVNGNVITKTLMNQDTLFTGWARINDFTLLPGFGIEDTAIIVRSNTTKPAMLIDQAYSGGNGAHGLIVKSNDADAIQAFAEGPLVNANALYAKGNIFVDSANISVSKGDIRLDDGVLIIDSAAVPNVPNEGTVRYTGTDFIGYDGTTWRSFTGGTAAWGTAGGNVYRNSGLVGIGVIPSGGYTLDAHGEMRFSPTSANRDFFITNVGTEPALIPESSNWGYIGSATNRLFQGHFTNLTVYGTFTNTSDRKIKENIRPLSGSLEKLLQLEGKSYDLKREYLQPQNNRSDEKTAAIEKARKDKVGFIAQEVKEIFPELVKFDEASQLHSVDYIGIIPVLVESVKEQQSMIDRLTKQLGQLEERIKELEQDQP